MLFALVLCALTQPAALFAEGAAAASGKTADSQSDAPGALELTKRVRQALVNSDELSTNAKNVKIISDEAGRIVLRGRVESAEERQTVASIAAKSAGGAERVTNEITVADDEERAG